MRRNCSLWFCEMEAVDRDVLLVRTHLLSQTFHFSRSTGDGANATLWRDFFYSNPSAKCHFCICEVCRNLPELLMSVTDDFQRNSFFFFFCISRHPFLLSFCLCSEVSRVALLYDLSWGLDWACHLVQLADVTGIMLLLTGRQASAGCRRTGSLLEASELGLCV